MSLMLQTRKIWILGSRRFAQSVASLQNILALDAAARLALSNASPHTRQEIIAVVSGIVQLTIR